MSCDDTPRDPVTGRVPPSPDDLREPTAVPPWPVGSSGRPTEEDDRTGITEIERRLLDVLENEGASRHGWELSIAWAARVY